MQILILIVISYLIGSLPTAYIITKIVKKSDIRNYGSGNPGATNVYRVVGPVAGIITFIIDFAKGYLPTFYALNLFGQDKLIYSIAAGLFIILGHITMPLLKFRGGKGVATGTGIFLALMPIPTLIAVLTFILVLAITRYVSLSSIIASISLPISSWLIKIPGLLVIFAALSSLIIIYTHRTNIKRLISGTELNPVKKT
ncbi:MAG: glycerol-3-phosphate 1-O-acyltransferase PlsY [Endomicrobiales bacterium]|nr:glycerol-3-phosphate 1-O-acyltransferase PlsY [Endomicrobiales bacterium]